MAGEKGHFFGPGGFLDVESLGGTEGVLDIASGLNKGLTEGTVGLIRANTFDAQAGVQRQNADAIRLSGKFAIASARRAGRLTIGAQRAQIGASGVTMSGSALDVLVESAFEAERNALLVKYDFDSREAAALFAAELSEFNATTSRIAGLSAGIGSLGAGFLSSQQRRNP